MKVKSFKDVLLLGMSSGIALMCLALPDFNSLIISIIEKNLNIETSIPPLPCLIIGFILFVVCLCEYKHLKPKTRVINIWGLGNNEYWENNNTNVLCINVCNFEKSNEKDHFINKKINEAKNYITKYMASGLSFSSMAPIPLVSIIGKQFSKIEIIDYYEYNNSNSTMSTLNNVIFFPKLKLKKCNINSIKDYGLITIGTTVKIQPHQLKQFNECLQYNNYIVNPKENAIFSKKQLFNYSRKIIEEIYEMSGKDKIKRIYLVFSSQSSLPYEIAKQLNERIAKEVIVCHYDSNSDRPYKWGIIITGKNAGKYIELGAEINE